MDNIIKIDLIDDTSKIDVELTDYNDKEVRDDIEELRQTKVDKIEGKGLSTNDYTTIEKTKLASLENYDDSEVRALIDTKQPRGNYALKGEIPTKNSQLQNDSGFISQEIDPTVPNHVKNITQNNITTWNNKQDALVSGTNIKTINNESLLGNGNLEIEGVTDYSELSNKPSINNVTLSGNKSLSDLGIQPAGSYATTTDLATKQDITDNNLTTTNKTIPTAINEVNSIAKGANQAVGYNNYSAMITAINSMDDEEFSMGQNIYIVTVNVPDLWVSSVESTSSTYTYVDDATFVSALETNGYVQVGYYKLSMLETQKVDLTNYVENTDFASSSKGGVIKTGASYGTTMASGGTLRAIAKTYEDYSSAGNYMFVGKGTLENVIAGKELDLKQLSTFDSTKTQVLKNINGTLTWIDE